MEDIKTKGFIYPTTPIWTKMAVDIACKFLKC